MSYANYPLFGNLSLGNVSGNIKLIIDESGIGNLSGIGYNNNSITFGVNQSATDIPEMTINRIGDVNILGNVLTGGNVVITSSTSALQLYDNTRVYSAQAYDQIIPDMGVHLSNFGSNWIQNTSAPSITWISISNSASGQYQTACASTNSYIYTSSNFGITWTQNTSAPQGYWLNVAVSATGQYQIVCDQSGNRRVWISSDYGKIWTQTTLPQKFWSSVSISSNGQYQTACFFESGVGYIYRSSDYGNTWTQSNAPSESWKSVSISSSGQYQSAVSSDGSLQGNIYTSSDYGLSWSQTSAISDRWWAVSISATGQYQTAVTSFSSQGNIYISSNYGSTWTKSLSLSNSSYSVSISATGQYQAAAAYGGTIYISSNYGNIWTPTTAPLSNWLAVSVSANGQYLSGVVSNGSIYRSNVNVNTFSVDANNNLSYSLGYVSMGNTAPSTSTTTGALRVAGGAGIIGNVYSGGIVVVNAIVPSTSTTTGALVVSGGAGIVGNIFLGGNLITSRDIDCNGNIQIDSIMPSTSTTTGALVVAGGAGIVGNIFLGGNLITSRDINCAGNITLANKAYIGPTFTGGLSVSGALVINEAIGSTRTQTTGSLVISHNNSFGNSSIVFPSRNNTTSDYGFIEYQESSNIGSGETGTLLIGIENDAGTDNIVLYSSLGTGRVGVNTLTPQRTLDVSGTLRANNFLLPTTTPPQIVGTRPVLAYTFPPDYSTTSINISAVNSYIFSVYLTEGSLVWSVSVWVETAAAGAGSITFSLWDSFGNQRATSAAQTTFNGVAIKTIDFTTPYTIPSSGFYYIAVAYTTAFTTQPTFAVLAASSNRMSYILNYSGTTLGTTLGTISGYRAAFAGATASLSSSTSITRYGMIMWMAIT